MKKDKDFLDIQYFYNIRNQDKLLQGQFGRGPNDTNPRKNTLCPYDVHAHLSTKRNQDDKIESLIRNIYI